MNNMQHILGFFMSGSKDTVIDIKHTVYAVAWLAINQSVRFTLLISLYDSNLPETVVTRRSPGAEATKYLLV